MNNATSRIGVDEPSMSLVPVTRMADSYVRRIQADFVCV